MIFFIIGALISVFSGAFEVMGGLENVKLAFLLLLGLLVGLVNISDKEQINFLVASVAFLFSSYILMEFAPHRIYLLNGLFVMLENFMIFIAPAAIVIALKLIFEYGSESNKEFMLELPSPHERHFLANLWDMILFVAVAFVFVILILENFFDLSVYPTLRSLLMTLDYVILGVFVIDLVVIYRCQKNVLLFLRRNWLDIIAVLPLGSIFRLTKLVRLVRIIRIFSRAEKAAKVNRVSKFFSGDSGFNRLLAPSKKKDSAKGSKRSGSSTKKTSAKQASSTKSKAKKSKKSKSHSR